MSLAFSKEAEREFQDILGRYPRKDAALLPVLWLAQKEFDHLSQDACKYVAERLELSLARVESVVSFYTLYKTKRLGKHHLQVCRNISCSLRGCDKVMKMIEDELNIKPGETTADGLFTYSHVECLAACGGAPALQVEADYHENLTPESMKELIRKLKADGKDR